MRARHVNPVGLQAAATQLDAAPMAVQSGDHVRLLRILAWGAPIHQLRGAALIAAAARGEVGAEMAALLLVWGDDPLARPADGRSLEEIAVAAGATATGQLVPLLRSAAGKAAEAARHAVPTPAADPTHDAM